MAQPAALNFDQRVYALVAQIPPGRLATYGQIAEPLGCWGCARQVGWALRRLQLPSEVPWQRVVNAKGRISFSPAREGSDWIQRQLLMEEGIPVNEQGVLALRRYLWTRAEAACCLLIPLLLAAAPGGLARAGGGGGWGLRRFGPRA